MRKWLPYVLAAVLGVGVAVLGFGPRTAGSGKERPERTGPSARAPLGEAPPKEPGVVLAGDGSGTEGPEDEPPALPPPGTLRPQNKAEIAHSARLARPFNKHFDYTSSWWQRAGQLIGAEHPALAGEAGQIVKLLREQSKKDDDQLDQTAVIAREHVLIAKVRAAGVRSPELDKVLTYLQESGQAVLDGQDPAKVVKPVLPASR